MVGWAEAAPPELGPAPVSVTGSLLTVSGFGTCGLPSYRSSSPDYAPSQAVDSSSLRAYLGAGGCIISVTQKCPQFSFNG